jgi:glycerol-3-phosphate dehydrogenase (NAD(P)+)
MSKPLKYAVFGAGSWATAIVKMLCENLEEVGWYMRSVDIKVHLQEELREPRCGSSVGFGGVEL